MKPRRTAEELARSADRFRRADEHERALYLCELAAAEDPRHPLAHFVRGRCLDELGRFAEAVAAYETAARLDPRDADIQAGLGEALEHAGKLEEACLCYSRAIDLDGAMIGPLLSRAAVSARLADFESAWKDLAEYLKHRPDSADALVLRGACHLAFGRKKKAEADFARAIALDPAEKSRVDAILRG